MDPFDLRFMVMSDLTLGGLGIYGDRSSEAAQHQMEHKSQGEGGRLPFVCPSSHPTRVTQWRNVVSAIRPWGKAKCQATDPCTPQPTTLGLEP